MAIEPKSAFKIDSILLAASGGDSMPLFGGSRGLRL
jgi:hypothetical protein